MLINSWAEQSHTRREQVIQCLSYDVKIANNTPGTGGGPGSGDRTLDIKRRKMPENRFFCKKIKMT